MNPGYTVVGEKGSEAMYPEENVSFTLGIGEEEEVSLGAIIPPIAGPYELAVAVRVYTTEQPDRLAHGDVAFYPNKITIKQPAILGLAPWVWIAISIVLVLLAIFTIRRYA